MSSHILRQMATSRDFYTLYSLPLPYIVAPLQDPDNFKSFAGNSPSYFRIDGKEDEDKKIQWESEPHPAAKEPLQLIDAFDRAAQMRHIQKWDMDINDGNKNNPVGIVQTLHLDGPMNPAMPVYLLSIEQPTWVVSHAATFNILQKHMPHLLDHSFHGSYYQDLNMAGIELAGHFQNAAKRLPANAVCLISGATFHFRDNNVSEDRIFLRARSQALAPPRRFMSA